MPYHFISIASGSSGNCYYVGVEAYGFLIDAGVGLRTIKKGLKENGIEFEKVSALFLTHDHTDHVKYAGVLGEKCSIPVYATEEVHESIACNRGVVEPIYQSKRILHKDLTIEFRDFRITPFEVPHDGRDNVGYSIEIGNKCLVVVTDVGHITSIIDQYVSRATQLVIEANYDAEMLNNGNYPPHLKARITNPRGHLANHETAQYLTTIISEKLSHIFLCHLSKENNHPELAYKTIEIELKAKGFNVGKDYSLVALKRNTASPMYKFE